MKQKVEIILFLTFRPELFQKNVEFSGPIILNSLPASIKEIIQIS